MNNEPENHDVDFTPLLSGRLSPEEAGLLEVAIEEKMRGLATPRIATVHDSAVLSRQGALMLLGTSGAGKTTLALACAQAGLPHLGDEFGYLDTDTSQCWHAEYPLGIKEDSPYLTSAREIGAPAMSPYGVRSTVCDRGKLVEAIGGCIARSGPRRTYPLAAIVHLARANSDGAELRRLSPKEWPEAILPSVDAPLTRNELYAKLIRVVAANEVQVVALHYHDAREAAQMLASSFEVTEPLTTSERQHITEATKFRMKATENGSDARPASASPEGRQ